MNLLIVIIFCKKRWPIQASDFEGCVSACIFTEDTSRKYTAWCYLSTESANVPENVFPQAQGRSQDFGERGAIINERGRKAPDFQPHSAEIWFTGSHTSY